MTLRCLLFGHVLGGTVARANRISVRCERCDRLSPGIVLDGPPPRVTQPKPRKRIAWLRAVYVKSR